MDTTKSTQHRTPSQFLTNHSVDLGSFVKGNKAKPVRRSSQNEKHKFMTSTNKLFLQNKKMTVPYFKALPRIETQRQSVSLVNLRKERDTERNQSLMLNCQIKHLEHEKQHCLRVVNRARRRYNSIIETRTKAFYDNEDVKKVFYGLKQKRQHLQQQYKQYLLGVKARAAQNKQMHHSRMSSWRGRAHTEAQETKISSMINRNLVKSKAEKEMRIKQAMVEQGHRNEMRLIEQKRQMQESRASISQENRQKKIQKQWEKTKSYIKTNQILKKKLNQRLEEYRRVAQRSNKQIQEMGHILQIKTKHKACNSFHQNLSSCTYYTNQTFLTKS